ncbi:MAG: restriction endonuclease [Rugosibacter sp.]|nr:restriction endonuclease [Rugosibacter sp.]
MARRRKTKESPTTALFKAPWWISILFAVLVLIFFKAVLPSMAASNLILKPIAAALSGMAWLFSGVLFFVGLLSFAREKFSTAKSANQRVTPKYRAIAEQPKQSEPGSPKIERPKPDEDRIWNEWKAVSATTSVKPTEWSIGLLRDLEWKRFEDVCQKFYALKGIKSETTQLGADGGIDIRLYQDDSGKPTSIVQCKAWGRYVGVKPIRELLGVMAHEKIEKAFFMASSHFTDEAKAFAKTNRITLIGGEMLVAMIKRLPDTQQQELLAFATEGNFTTPTCPSCGIKMRCVSGSKGKSAFWGCQNYPRCKQKIGVRATAAS